MTAGRIALVTGASGGLGPAVVRTLLDGGASVVAVGRTEHALSALQARLGFSPDRWMAYAADLTDAAGAQAAVDAALTRYGRLDILVAAAGGWRGVATVAETAPETLQWLWQINLVTAFNIIRAALPHMLSGGWGRIITIGARSAIGGQVRGGAYAASKAALLALTQSVAAESRQSGVCANTLLVSTIDTPANRAAMPDADYARWVTPEQIAAAVRFLCSDEAAAINGAAIPVYGRA